MPSCWVSEKNRRRDSTFQRGEKYSWANFARVVVSSLLLAASFHIAMNETEMESPWIFGEKQDAALALIPRITGALSFMGSSLIIYEESNW